MWRRRSRWQPNSPSDGQCGQLRASRILSEEDGMDSCPLSVEYSIVGRPKSLGVGVFDATDALLDACKVVDDAGEGWNEDCGET